MKKTTVLDLEHNHYSLEVLKENIYATGLFDILRTQKLNEEFAVNYILNERFQLSEEEEKITIDFVLKMQSHLDKDKLLKLYIIGPTDYDFPNFEKYAIENETQ
jgi:hypothetical protein